jgi:hypothetical protein
VFSFGPHTAIDAQFVQSCLEDTDILPSARKTWRQDERLEANGSTVVYGVLSHKGYEWVALGDGDESENRITYANHAAVHPTVRGSTWVRKVTSLLSFSSMFI